MAGAGHPRRRARRAGAGKKARKKASRPAIAQLALVAALTTCFFAGAWLIRFPETRPEGGPESARFAMRDGESVRALADRLEAEGLVTSGFQFAIYLRALGADHRLREGTVRIPRGASASEVARRVARGLGRYSVRVLVPEGMNRFRIAERLAHVGLVSEEAFLAATEDPLLLAALEIPGPSVEGYLFPDTYDLRDDWTAEEIITRMVDNHRRRMDDLLEAHPDALERLDERLGMDVNDVVTLASVVEKEAAVAEERPIIAGVFLNRLGSDTFLPRHRLQADPTVSYGCLTEPDAAPSCLGFDGRHITRPMLRDRANRYNTYRHAGLPPGPVSNPGRGSLEAVLAPTAHDYLYFVARGHRRHAFAADLDTHNRNVDRYIRGR